MPPERTDDLAFFDGSVLVDRTRGELSARSDSEEANFLALNLAYDVVADRKDPGEARRQYAEALLQNKHNEYKTGFLFAPPVFNQAAADQPYRLVP